MTFKATLIGLFAFVALVSFSSLSISNAATKVTRKTASASKCTGKTQTAHFETDAGDFEIELCTDNAPKTVENFVANVNEGFYIGGMIYRSVQSGKHGTPTNEPHKGNNEKEVAADAALKPIVEDQRIDVIQGGKSIFPVGALPPIALETTGTTKLTHSRGAISMARDVVKDGALNTATSEWFIVVQDSFALDEGGNRLSPPLSDKNGFAVFGYVTKGLKVIESIHKRNVFSDSKHPKKLVIGQRIQKPVVIRKVTLR